MNPDCVFVYGTLRLHTDHFAHELLRGRSTFLGQATVHGRLYDLGRFPGAIPVGEPGDRIHGEAYRIAEPEHTFTLIDEYEGCSDTDPIPHAFRRDRVIATLESGEEIECAIYWFTGVPAEASRIETGDYLRRS